MLHMNWFFFVLDINELNLPKTCTTEFPDPDDLLNFKLIICPDEVSKQLVVYNNKINFIKNNYSLVKQQPTSAI